MKIVFVDNASPASYSLRQPIEQAMGIGGAEASLARVAAGLAAMHEVTVVQRARTGLPECAGGVKWVSTRQGRASLRAADVVVIQRRVIDVALARLQNRSARIFIWYHDWYFPAPGDSGRWRVARQYLVATLRALIHLACSTAGVTVSAAHQRNLREHLGAASGSLGMLVPIGVIPNAIAVRPEVFADAVVDQNRMIYCSAAWKGLPQVLAAFAAVREELPDMVLEIATPGYGVDDPYQSAAGTRALGHLEQSALLERVSTSLCVFYPASSVPETFGLVFAESHAVGTPVLAHDFGAASELLTADELVDARDVPSVVARVKRWRDGRRPRVTAHEAFRVERVVSAWAALLQDGRLTSQRLDGHES